MFALGAEGHKFDSQQCYTCIKVIKMSHIMRKPYYAYSHGIISTAILSLPLI